MDMLYQIVQAIPLNFGLVFGGMALIALGLGLYTVYLVKKGDTDE